MNGYDQTTETQRPPWKIVALVAGAATLAVALIIGAILFVRSRQRVEIATENMDRINSQLATSLAGCAQEPDPDACRKKKVLLAAQATGAASVCEQLEGVDHDACVWTVASDRKDPESCAAIFDDARRNYCSDVLYLKAAISSMDGTTCQKIVGDKAKASCLATIAGPVTVSNCAERGKDAAFCSDLAAMNAAISASDLEACKAISTTELRAECEDAIGIPDFDKDGLDAEEEAQYGSSDRLADTDGDGYSDKDEIEAGYNPNGDGKLAL